MSCINTNNMFIKQEPSIYEDEYSLSSLKQEPEDIQDDLQGFDPHAWVVDHFKLEPGEAEPYSCDIQRTYDWQCGSNTASRENDNMRFNYTYTMPEVSIETYVGNIQSQDYRINAEQSMCKPDIFFHMSFCFEYSCLFVSVPACSKFAADVKSMWFSLEKHFRCDICKKRFSTKGNLGNHMRSHTQEKPFRCNTCGRCFSFNCNLKTHYLTHTGIKPFQCTICGKCFSTKGNMSVHLRIHTGERPYKCTICSKAFTVKDNLQRHMKVHFSV